MAEIGIVVSMICLCTDVRSPCISEGSSEISEIVKKRRKKKNKWQSSSADFRDHSTDKSSVFLESIVLIKPVYVQRYVGFKWTGTIVIIFGIIVDGFTVHFSVCQSLA